MNLKNNTGFIKQSLYSFFVIIFNIAISLYAIKDNISTLGQNTYGLWILIFGIFNLLIVLNFGYTSASTISHNIKTSSNTDKILEGNYTVLFLQSILYISLLSYLYIYPESLFKQLDSQDEAKNLILCMAPGGLFLILSTFFETVLFLNYKQIFLKNTFELIRLGVMYLLFVFALRIDGQIYMLGITYSIINFLLFVYTLYKFKKTTGFSLKIKEFNFDFLTKNFSLANSFWIPSICFMVLNQADSIFISIFIKDLAIVTMYSQCYRLQDISLKFIRKITETKFPKILQHYHLQENSIVHDMYKKILIVNLLISSVATLAIIFLGKIVLDWWLKDLIVFDQKIILSIAFLCISSSIHMILWNFINLINQPKLKKRIAILEIVVNLSLSFYLVNTLGIIGLPIATIIAQSCTIIISSIVYIKFTRKYSF